MLTRRQFLVRMGSGVAVGAGVALGAGCGGSDIDPTAPPVIRYGAERCAYCTMSIDDTRFASAWRTPASAERHFDDIGCMVNAYRREGPSADSRFWVHNYSSQEWLDAGVATYLIAPSIKTPMAYGVAAFTSPSEATAVLPAAKTTLVWTDLLSTLERKG